MLCQVETIIQYSYSRLGYQQSELCHAVSGRDHHMAMEYHDINSQNSVFHAVSGRTQHMAIEDQDISSQNSVFNAVSGRDHNMAIVD
jgi:hypothetical protein